MKKVSFSFLNMRFDHLEKEEKMEFFECAWDEHNLTGNTHLLERYTTGLAFAQMSAKQGIKKYDKEAELKLIAEFAQLLEYQVFHGVKADGPDGINDNRSALLDGFPKSWLDNKLLDLWVLFSILVGSSVLVGGVF
jgi:hypothetical protein